MKKLIFAMITIFASGAFAIQFPQDLPKKLVCTVKSAPSKEVKSFVIKGLNTSKPTISIPDAQLLDSDLQNTHLINVSFSNECDNLYDITFHGNDLAAMAQGSIQEINGFMNYFSYEFESGKSLNGSATVMINCTAQ